MKFSVEVDLKNKKKAVTELELLIAMLLGDKKPAKGRKVKEEEIPDFDEDEEEVEEDEEEEYDVDDEEYERPLKKTKKKTAKKVAKKSTKKVAKKSSGKVGKASKVSLKEVMGAFKETHTKLSKKLKSKTKAQTKINSLLKKHGAKSVRTLDAKNYSKVMSELKKLK